MAISCHQLPSAAIMQHSDNLHLISMDFMLYRDGRIRVEVGDTNTPRREEIVDVLQPSATDGTVWKPRPRHT